MARWTVSDTASFRLVDFDDGAVLFDRRSGQTHILNGLAAEAFAALCGDPLTPEQLAQALIQAIEGDPEGDIDRAAVAVIGRLDSLGVIDRVAG
jgi:PqqD family protein of HPr-rel-A system